MIEKAQKTGQRRPISKWNHKMFSINALVWDARFILNMKIFIVAAILLLIANSRVLHKHDSVVANAGNDPVLNNPFSSTLSRLVGPGNTLGQSTVSSWSGTGSNVGGNFPAPNFPGQNFGRPGFQGPNMGGFIGSNTGYPQNFGSGINQAGWRPTNLGGSGFTSGNANWPATSMSLSGYRPTWGTMSGSQWTPNWSNNVGGLISLSGIRCSGGVAISGGSQMGGRPIRLTCDAYRSSDICTTPQQCANLMCSRYIRCPSTPRISAAWSVIWVDWLWFGILKKENRNGIDLISEDSVPFIIEYKMRSFIFLSLLVVAVFSRRLNPSHQSIVPGPTTPNPLQNNQLNNLLTKLPGLTGSNISSNSAVDNQLSSLLTRIPLGGTSSSSFGASTGGSPIRLTGVTCSNGAVQNMGSASIGGPTRLSCTINGQTTSDICTSLQQCANLMCARYIKCPGKLSMAAAWPGSTSDDYRNV